MLRLWLLVSLFGSVSLALAQGLHFRQLESQQGLSHNSVTAITQDFKGFIWVGTIDGLNRHDGYGFKIFKPKHGQAGSISDNRITALLATQNQLWVGCDNGLNTFNYGDESFKHIDALAGSHIISLAEASDGNLWVATTHGLKLIDTTSERLIPIDQAALTDHIPLSFERSLDKLWIGTEKGITLFRSTPFQSLTQLEIGKVSAMLTESRERHWIAGDFGVAQIDTGNQLEPTKLQSWRDGLGEGSSLVKDLEGRIWLGTNAGLFRFIPALNQWENIEVHREGLLSALTGINQLFVDRSGLLWVATQRMGLYIHSIKSEHIRHYDLDSDASVKAFVENPKGKLWIGAARDLYTFDQDAPQAKPVARRLGLAAEITSLCSGWENNLLIGTDRQGLLSYDLHKNQLKSVSLSEQVRSIHQMIRLGKSLWLATPRGLFRYDQDTEILSSWHTSNGLPSDNIYSLLADGPTTLYLGSESSLVEFSLQTNTFRSWSAKQRNHNSQRFHVLHQNKPDEVWIGTPQGLLQFDRRRETFRSWTTADGLPNDDIRGIVSDAHGQLWVSTQQGFARLPSGAFVFTSFGTVDGALASEFVRGAALQTSGDRILFGGLEGFNLITPSLLTPSNFQPDVVFTQFKIQNALVLPGPQNMLKQSIETTRFLDMPYGHYLLSFQFAALDYGDPEDNQYAYKLEGHDTEWTYVGADSRAANFTHLEPGAYTLRVKGSNRDGAWSSDEASIFLVIRPPWWRSTWAYVIYGTLLLLAISIWPMIHLRATKNRRIQLERLIASRNRDLEFKNNELRNMNLILRAINETMNRDSLMRVLLEKGSLLVPRAEKSRFLFLDDREQCFRFSASAGYQEPDLAKVSLTREQALEWYAPESQRMAAGIYNIGQQHIQKIHDQIEVPCSTLSMTLMVGPTLAGFLIFDNFSDTRAFDQSDVERLLRLRDHAVTATSRIVLMEELQHTTHRLTETRGQLMEAAHLAGRTDTIKSLLHNIGNALNSLNVSAEMMRKDIASNETLTLFGRLIRMLEDNSDDLPRFFSEDPRATKLAQAFQDIFLLMGKGREATLQEMDTFIRTVESICNIINAEQRYANGNYLVEDVALNELFDNILLMFSDSLSSDKIHISCNCEDHLIVRLQRPKFIQVIVNLIQNAREAMLTQPEELGRNLRITARRHKEEAVILISDTGPGIDTLDLTRIFHLGYTTKAEGTGYGLHYCANAMTEMQGSISVENGLGGGAYFHLTLPLSPRKDPTVAQAT